MKYKSKRENNNFRKESKPNHNEISEQEMLFANQKELWVCNGSAINVYNPVSGSLIEVKEKHENKIISLCRVSDVYEEDYEIVSCDENGLVCHWCSKDHKNYDKSFSLPVWKNFKITHFTYGDTYFVATFTGKGSATSNLVYIKHRAKQFKIIEIAKYVKIGQHKVALSYDRKYVSALKEKTLFVQGLTNIYDKERKFIRFHKIGQIDQECIAYHPTKHIIATGGVNGCITLWYQFTEKHPTKVKLHWHTVPAQTICFSSTGGDLYSGGKECVLVRWYVTDNNRRSFLPRLGMPIQNVQCDPTSTYVAVLHSDYSISIINSKEMKLEGTLQIITKHVPEIVDSNFPSSKILLYHEPTSSFIKTGKTGYMQFFNPRQSKVNYDLEITMTNFVTEERTKKLPNFEITCAAIFEDGVWLATVEMCLLTPSLKEIIMKFWHYSLKAQRWELNTTIHTPHLDTITSVVFCPLTEEEAIPTCISCSEDGKFKVWKLITYTDVKGAERSLWNCQTSRGFRDLPATACAFSQDTSLLAVAFESLVTIWSPDKYDLKRILTQPFLTESIKTLIFSHERWKGSALVTRSENYICTWDLLSCSLLCRVYIRSSCLVKDPQTGLLAAFSNRNDVYFFDPQSTEPISSKHNIESEVTSAIFAPYVNPSKEDSKGKATSTLFYYDKNQNLHRIEPPALIGPESIEGNNKYNTLAIEDVKVGVGGDVYENSDLFAAFSARTKNISKKSEELVNTEIDLTPPSLKTLLKDLHEVQIHNLTFSGFVDHFSSFLPNVCLIADNKIKPEEDLKYETFDEERRKREDKKSVLDSYIMEESQRIEQIQHYDFNNMLKML